MGTGWGSAYEHSFVDQDAADVVFASIHSDDGARIEQAAEIAKDYEGVTLYHLTPDGTTMTT